MRRARGQNIFSVTDTMYPTQQTSESTTLYQTSTGTVWDWLYLAMIEWRRQNPQKARQHLDLVRRWFHERGLAPDEPAHVGSDHPRESHRADTSVIPWPRRLELRILLEQASQLIGQQAT